MKAKQQLTPAVACIRMSSAQQEASPERQRAELATMAKAHGFSIVREYVDEGISGVDTHRRKGFQQMLADVQRKDSAKVILCWDQDRFSRLDSIDSGEIIAPLRRAGVRLITVTQGEINWNDFAGRMMFSIQQEQKNRFLHDLSANCVSGRERAARRGQKFVVPYGYDREILDESGKVVRRVHFRERFAKPKSWTTRIVPTADAEALANLKWLFDSFAWKGLSICEIIVELRKRRTMTPSGKGRWHWETVRTMLANQVYIGRCINGSRKAGKFHSLKEPIIVDNAHPAIVSARTFSRVQELLKEATAKAPRRAPNSPYILTGVLRCGHCGRHMCGKINSRPPRNRSYYCPSALPHQEKNCPGAYVVSDYLESYVLRTIVDGVLSGDNLSRLRAIIQRRLEVSHKRNPDRDKTRRRRIAELQADIKQAGANLARAKGSDFDAIATTLAEWRAELLDLQAEVAPAGNEGTPAQVAEMLIEQFKEMREQLLGQDPTHTKAAIRQIVESVSIRHPDGSGRFSQCWEGEVVFRDSLGGNSVGFTHFDLRPRQTEATAAIVRSLFKASAVTNKAYMLASGSDEPVTASMQLRRAAQAGLIQKVGTGLWEPIEGVTAGRSVSFAESNGVNKQPLRRSPV